MAVCGALGFGVWDSFLRYSAYGLVEGRVVQVAAPWAGVVEQLHVTEGQQVAQGELLITMDNFDIRQQMDQLNDQLRIAQATLEADISRIKWHYQGYTDRIGRAKSEYLQLWGELLGDQERLRSLERAVARTLELQRRDAVGVARVDALAAEEAALRKKVEKLIPAVEHLKAQSEQSTLAYDEGYDQLKPAIAEIQSLQSQLRRLRERLDRGHIRAPVAGTVVRRHRLTGERADEQQTVLEILEAGSLEVVLYVPQEDSEHFELELPVELEHAPQGDALNCQVTVIPDRYEPAPDPLKRYYRSGQQLLPIRLAPEAEVQRWMALRLGAMVRLKKSL